jgi:hypothetical protein
MVVIHNHIHPVLHLTLLIHHALQHKDHREHKEHKDGKAHKDHKDHKDIRVIQALQEHRDTQEHKENRVFQEPIPIQVPQAPRVQQVHVVQDQQAHKVQV